MQPYYKSDNTDLFEKGVDFTLYKGDCCDILPSLPLVNMIFADPPYFLSNDGLTVNSGKIVSVNKGDWDKKNIDIDEFNRKWLQLSRDRLVDNGTIWVCGTMHNIYSIAKVLEEFKFKILNTITWQKKNPPPNFSCRCFTHSTEFIIWAKKVGKKGTHYFNYDLMKALNNNKQMQDVWSFSAIAPWEKKYGKHPTQKPLSVLSRVVLSSSQKGDIVLDPFNGSGTTGIAANLFGRNYIGIDMEEQYLETTKQRYMEAKSTPQTICKKIQGVDMNIVGALDK